MLLVTMKNGVQLVVEARYPSPSNDDLGQQLATAQFIDVLLLSDKVAEVKQYHEHQ